MIKELFSVEKNKSFVRAISVLSVLCLIFTSFILMDSETVYGAAKVKVTKVKFSKKTVDATMDVAKAKVTISLNKKVKGANCAYITLKSGKKKATVFTKGVKGKKITATLSCNYYQSINQILSPGKWKVTNVVLKKGKSQRKWQPGKISGDKYYSGFYYTVFKSGKTLAKGKSSKKQTMTVIAGEATSISITEPASAESGTNPTFTAQVKKSNGGAVSGGNVTFKFLRGKGTLGTVTAAVNSNGIAQTTFTVPDKYYEEQFKVEASYLGVKGKYRQSSAAKYVDMINPTVNVQGKFYKDGENYIISAKLTNARTGAPVSGVSVNMFVMDGSSNNTFFYGGSLDKSTESDGTYTWVLDWKDFKTDKTPTDGHKAKFTVGSTLSNYIFADNPREIPFGKTDWF